MCSHHHTGAQGFDTTQGKHVEDEAANVGGIKTQTTRVGRQYMNRRVRRRTALPLLPYGCHAAAAAACETWQGMAGHLP